MTRAPELTQDDGDIDQLIGILTYYAKDRRRDRDQLGA
jgi:hypothetical protein